MSKPALILSAAVMLVLAAPAMAQQPEGSQSPASQGQQSQSPDQAQSRDSSQQDSSVLEPQNAYGPSGGQSSSADQRSAQSDPGQPAGQPGVQLFLVQPPNIPASDLIGVTVYNERNEPIGDVADLVLDENANLKALVLKRSQGQQPRDNDKQ